MLGTADQGTLVDIGCCSRYDATQLGIMIKKEVGVSCTYEGRGRVDTSLIYTSPKTIVGGVESKRKSIKAGGNKGGKAGMSIACAFNHAWLDN